MPVAFEIDRPSRRRRIGSMAILQLSPDQEAHLVALVAGRSRSEVVREAVALWERVRQNDRALVAFRASLDQAEASIAQDNGPGSITR